MDDLSKLRLQLQRFGLTKDQAAIYLLLVSHKQLRIQAIAQLAGLPRSSVYENLKRLYELGIAEEIIDEHHKSVRPYPIGTLRHNLDERLTDLQKLTTDLRTIEQALAVTPFETLSHQTTVRYYKNRSGARQLLWNTLKAKMPVYVYSEWGRNRYVGLRFYENFVTASRERAIQERVLINPSPGTFESIRRFNIIGVSTTRTKVEDIRVIESHHMLIKGETFIYDNVYAQIYLNQIEINGFEIESQHFANSQRSIFETLWDLATPVTSFL